MKRVIFILENGRKTYSMGDDGPDVYTPEQLHMVTSLWRQGQTWGFDVGFRIFGEIARLEEAGFNMLAIVDYELQDANEPIIEEYLR